MSKGNNSCVDGNTTATQGDSDSEFEFSPSAYDDSEVNFVTFLSRRRVSFCFSLFFGIHVIVVANISFFFLHFILEMKSSFSLLITSSYVWTCCWNGCADIKLAFLSERTLSSTCTISKLPHHMYIYDCLILSVYIK